MLLDLFQVAQGNTRYESAPYITLANATSKPRREQAIPAIPHAEEQSPAIREIRGSFGMVQLLLLLLLLLLLAAAAPSFDTHLHIRFLRGDKLLPS